jgi:hypothetical protein
MGGATIVPRSLKTTRNKKFSKIGPNCLIYMTLLYRLIIDFPKFEPLIATGMALCVNLGPKCQNLFRLVSD